MAKIFAVFLAIVLVFCFVSCLDPGGNENPGGNQDIAVTFQTLTADGSTTAQTTAITLTFDKNITGLAASGITLNAGTTGAVKGALTKSSGTGTYSLTVTGVTTQGTVSISVSKTGYAITGNPKTATVYPAPAPVPPEQVELITASNSGVPAYRFTPNAGETWSSFKEITFKVRVDDYASYDNSGGRLHVYGVWTAGFTNGWMGLGGGWDATYRLVWYQKGPNGTGTASIAPISVILGKNAEPPSSLVGQWVTYTLSIANNATDNVYIGNYNGANYPAGTSTGSWILGTGLTTNSGSISYYIKDVALVRKDNTQLKPDALDSNPSGVNPSVLLGTYSVSQTSGTDVTRSIVAAPPDIAPISPQNDAVITVNTAVKYQYVRGFGGMDLPWGNVKALSIQDYETMYDPGKLGYTIMRIMILPDNTNHNTTLNNIIKPGNRPNYIEGVKIVNKHGGYVLATPWSPPAAWKSNNSANGGGYLKKENYQDYANYLKSFCQIMAERGAPVFAISIQNEPNYFADGYAGCEWEPEEMRDFFKQVGHFTDGAPGYGGGQSTPFVRTMNGESANVVTIHNSALVDTQSRNAIDLLGRP